MRNDSTPTAPETANHAPARTPLPSSAAYIDAFSRAACPSCATPCAPSRSCAAREHAPGAREIAAVVLADPLMTLRLLTHLESNRRASQNHDITTIERAVLMLGVEPFFTAFSGLPTVEDTLAAHPEGAGRGAQADRARAPRGRRSRASSRPCGAITTSQEITVATLLHEATEIVCAIHAPTLTLEAIERRRTEPAPAPRPTCSARCSASARRSCSTR